MIKLITGPMFSGKTRELLETLEALEKSGKSIISLKPATDTRDSVIRSRDGMERKCVQVMEGSITIMSVIEWCDSYDVIAIDEAQFFSIDFIKTLVNNMNRKGKIVIVSGLDMDRFGEPFGSIPYVLSIADEIIKKKARCTDCNTEGIANTEYMESLGGDLICIGDTEYIALCKECREARLKKIIEEHDLLELHNRGFLKEVIYQGEICEIVLFGESNIFCSKGRRLRCSIKSDEVLFYKEGLIFNKNKKYF